MFYNKTTYFIYMVLSQSVHCGGRIHISLYGISFILFLRNHNTKSEIYKEDISNFPELWGITDFFSCGMFSNI